MTRPVQVNTDSMDAELCHIQANRARLQNSLSRQPRKGGVFVLKPPLPRQFYSWQQ